MLNSSPPSNQAQKKLYFMAIPLGLIAIYAFYHYSSPLQPLVYQELSLDHEEFKSFIQKYEKSYTDNHNYAEKFRVFRDNLAYIQVWNSQKHSWTLGVNQFADLTISEFKAQNLEFSPSSKINNEGFKGLRGPGFVFDQGNNDNSIINAPPPSVNWVNKGMVGPVVNQGEIGSSSVFVVANDVASVWAINGHGYTQLSYAELYDCVSKMANIDQYFEFVVKNGLTSAANYGSPTGTCNKAKVAQPVAKISSYVNVTPNSVTALENALALGPVVVAVEADQSAFMLYSSGVITSNCGTNLDHILLAVGYDTTASVPYYYAQNSWGTGWGMGGYVQIGIQSGPGVCGIQMAAAYPVV